MAAVLQFPHKLAKDVSPLTTRNILSAIRDAQNTKGGKEALKEVHRGKGLTPELAMRLIPEVETIYEAITGTKNVY